MKITVKTVAHTLSRDIDPERHDDVRKLDAFVNKCLTAATSALTISPLKGYSELEMGHLIGVVDGLRHSHFGIRHLLVEGDKMRELSTRSRLPDCNWKRSSRFA